LWTHRTFEQVGELMDAWNLLLSTNSWKNPKCFSCMKRNTYDVILSLNVS